MTAWFEFIQKTFPGMSIDEIQIMLAPLFASIMQSQKEQAFHVR